MKITNLPLPIMEKYRTVMLGVDIMMINKIRFFVCISRHIQFGTAEMIGGMKAPALVGSVKLIQQVYMQCGFRIVNILMDGQFECIRGELAGMGIQLNTVSAGKHVPEAECYIQMVKERVRSIYNTLPFRRMPALVVIELVKTSIKWLNNFPPKGGVSSPRAIITGKSFD